MNQLDAERSWLRLARRNKHKINLAWWLQSWAPLLVFASLLGFTSIFYLRSTGVEVALGESWLWLLTGVGAVALLAAWRARDKFTQTETSLVRLEAKLGLNSALTAARSGVAPWPELPAARARDGLAWRPLWLIVPPLLATVLLVAAFLLPVTPPEPDASLAPPEPGAWARVENSIDHLEDSALAEPEDLARVRDQVRQLRAAPEQEWFSADSLEASSSLEGAFNAGLTRMGRDMARADHTLGQLAKFGDRMSARARARAAEDFAAAAKNLETGKLRANKALRDQLKGIDPKALENLPPEKLEALRKQLQENADALRRIAGRAGAEEGPFEEGEGEPGQGGAGPNGEGDPEGEGGNGGLTEGPGHAPLKLGDPTDLGSDRPEGLESSDLKRAAAGDLLEELDGGHEIDETQVAPRAGGEIRSAGQGGDTVTRDQLLPSEKALLRKYFE